MHVRRLEPEWLDALPAADARARRARAELARVNTLMGNARTLAAALRPRLPRGRALRVADLGAGDGALALALARRLRGRRVNATLVDRAPSLPAATRARLAALGWNAEVAAEDVFDFLARAPASFDAIYANLFLHHFDETRLAALLAAIAHASPLFAACEPRRSGLALAASRLLWMLGCGPVTRHDAAASVRAGFADRELAALWPATAGWRIEERAAPPFGHLFVACAATR